MPRCLPPPSSPLSSAVFTCRRMGGADKRSFALQLVSSASCRATSPTESERLLLLPVGLQQYRAHTRSHLQPSCQHITTGTGAAMQLTLLE
eukprot:765336-Hanusia_phi.AAC.3